MNHLVLAIALVASACAHGTAPRPGDPLTPRAASDPALAEPQLPALPAATSVDTLVASGHGDEHAALVAVLRRAAARGGRPVVRLIGTFTDGSSGIFVPDGVRIEGPATIRFTSREMVYGALNIGRHVTVVDITLVGPWLTQSYDPHGRKHPGFNSGGNPDRHALDIELRRVVARGFAGAGFNSGEYVENLRVYRSRFLDNGDAGVQIGAEVVGFRVIGSTAARNRNNGFDINGSKGYLARDTAADNGRAAVSYPDGSSDLNGFLVWAVTNARGRHDAVDNVLEYDVSIDNEGRGYSLVGGTTAAIRGTVLRYASARGNRGFAYHVQGNAPLDGLGDNRDTLIDSCTGESLFVQHLGRSTARMISRLRLRNTSFARQVVEAPETAVVTP